MARQPMIARESLLDLVSEHLADAGIHRSTFRSIADALGISTMPLISCFGTRDNLLGEVIAWNEARQFDIALSVGSGLDAFERYWEWTVLPENLKYVRLDLEIALLASREPSRFGSAPTRSFNAWLSQTRDALVGLGLRPDEASREAGQLLPLLSGLQIDLLVTGDTDRVTQAFTAYLDALKRRIADARRPKKAAPRRRSSGSAQG